LILFGKISIVTNYIFKLFIIRDLFFGYKHLMRHKMKYLIPYKKLEKVIELLSYCNNCPLSHSEENGMCSYLFTKIAVNELILKESMNFK